MTFSIRTLVATAALAAAGIAQAGEMSEPPKALSTKSRAEVAAEARRAPATNELYDGREHAAPGTAMPMRSRDAVRAEARQGIAAQRASIYTGG